MSTLRAMRRLKPDPVPDELLERLVQAAVWGPSGSNAQGYQYVVVTDPAVMARLAPLWERCVDAYMATAGGAVPEGMDPAAYERMVAAIRHQRDHFAETAGADHSLLPVSGAEAGRGRAEAVGGGAGGGGLAAADARAEADHVADRGVERLSGVQNLLLAARGLGLAANITIWHLMLEQEWKRALAIPKDVKTFAVIPVGWPLGRFGPVRRRPVEKVIRRDGW